MTEPVAAPQVPVGKRRTRRTVLWICIGLAVVAAVLVAVLAQAGQASQVTAGSPLIGKPAPAVSGTPLGGGAPVSWSQFSGKWVLVNFSASWCVPCQQEMPQLLTFAHDEATTDQAQILTVAYDETDLSNLHAFLQSRKITWPAIDDPNAKVQYGLHGIPESYLVDAAGRVVEKITGGVNADQLEQFIAQYSPGTGPGTKG